MTKAERIAKKNSTRYCKSYSRRARWYFDFMHYGHFSREQMMENCHNYYFHNIEYDVEKDECVRYRHKQWAIIACRLAKKIHRMK